MNNLRRSLLVSTASGLAAAAAYAATPRLKLADTLPKVDLEAMFPKSFGEWQIDRFTPVIQPSPEVQAKLNQLYNQTLARTYLNPAGARIMLSVAYGGDQSDGLQVHLPEVCYPAQGFGISELRNDVIEQSSVVLPVRRMRAQLGRRIEQVSYWSIIGAQITSWGTNRKFAQMKYALKGLVPDGFLVRISSIESRPQVAFTLQDQFSVGIIAAFSASDRIRLTGLTTVG